MVHRRDTRFLAVLLIAALLFGGAAVAQNMYKYRGEPGDVELDQLGRAELAVELGRQRTEVGLVAVVTRGIFILAA